MLQFDSPNNSAIFDPGTFPPGPSSTSQSLHNTDERTFNGFASPECFDHTPTASLLPVSDVHYDMQGGVAPIGGTLCSSLSPNNSLEAYLLLEAARSDRAISSLRKDLTFELVHRNTIALQLNRIMLEKAQQDLHDADEHVGSVRFSIRRSGHSVAAEYAMQEAHLLRCHRHGHKTAGSNSPLVEAGTPIDVVLD